MYTVMIDFADGTKLHKRDVLSFKIRMDHTIELIFKFEPPLTVTKRVSIISVFRDE